MSKLKIPLPEWKMIGTVQTRILVLDVNIDTDEFHALDLKSGIVFPILTNKAGAVSCIKEQQEYEIKFKVFKAEIFSTPRDKWLERIKASREIGKVDKVLPAPKLRARYKFELLCLSSNVLIES